MSTGVKAKCFDITVSICAEDEIRLRDNCSATPEVRQKKVSIEEGPEESHWTFAELKDIACFLHDAPEFKTNPAFTNYSGLITNLGWTLVHEHNNREAVVTAMLHLMKYWFNACTNDPNCIPPPSREVLSDKDQLKILAAMEALKLRLARAELDVAEKTKVAIQSTSLGATAKLTPFQEQILANAAAEEHRRVTA